MMDRLDAVTKQMMKIDIRLDHVADFLCGSAPQTVGPVGSQPEGAIGVLDAAISSLAALCDSVEGNVARLDDAMRALFGNAAPIGNAPTK